ncbi:MAG: phosphatidylglycerol lysyltransferase domain-containing protein [Oscillospiraceae bacterium]|jgi:hypothetical protein|nr:phosphatidylglycerol lysyltransferase domain-containing protein [Oscillospiraceae bacterium]
MLDFAPIALEHKPEFDAFSSRAEGRITEHSFASLYAWAPRFKTELCRKGAFLYLRTQAPQPVFLMPMGEGDLSEALYEMETDAKRMSIPFQMRGLTRETVRRVEAARPDRYVFAERRDQADYLYAVNDLRDLPGRGYHAKRNFITRFENQYAGRWQYEDITKDNLNDVWAFQDKWCRKNDCASSITLQEESTAIAMLLYNLDALGAFGGLLRVDGAVTAFTVGSLIGRDTLDVNVEKADYDVVGSYPMINRAFVRRRCEELSYINREEDIGIEGLRRAKLSYRPVELILKYDAALREA